MNPENERTGIVPVRASLSRFITEGNDAE